MSNERSVSIVNREDDDPLRLAIPRSAVLSSYFVGKCTVFPSPLESKQTPVKWSRGSLSLGWSPSLCYGLAFWKSFVQLFCYAPCANLRCIIWQLPSESVDSLLKVNLHCIGSELRPCPLWRLHSRGERDLLAILRNCTENLLLDDLIVRHSKIKRIPWEVTKWSRLIVVIKRNREFWRKAETKAVFITPPQTAACAVSFGISCPSPRQRLLSTGLFI